MAEGRKTKRVAREGDGHSLKKSALEIGGAVSAVQALKGDGDEEENGATLAGRKRSLGMSRILQSYTWVNIVFVCVNVHINIKCNVM